MSVELSAFELLHNPYHVVMIYYVYNRIASPHGMFSSLALLAQFRFASNRGQRNIAAIFSRISTKISNGFLIFSFFGIKIS